jgi:hypothetical protein
MARDFERRLARAETAAHALGGVDAQAERRRCSLQTVVAVCDIVRERLVAMRIDPELAVALRRGEEAAAELAGMPDTRELRASEAAMTGPNFSGARDRAYTEMVRIAGSMTERVGRGEEPINLGNASLVELLAFVSAFDPIALTRPPCLGNRQAGGDCRAPRLCPHLR